VRGARPRDDGYLERRPDSDDHRSRRVHLTPRGRDAAMAMRSAVSQIETEWATLLGHHDFGLLTRLSEALTRSEPSSAPRGAAHPR
jgi:DNA-binding MarR family transcriptional regulator